MLARTRHAASRLLTSSLTKPTPSLSSFSSSSFTLPRLTIAAPRLLHTSSLASASHAVDSHGHASHGQSHVDPKVARYLGEDVNGWFVGEVPGYRGDFLPGAGSRFYASTFFALMAACYAAFIVAHAYKDKSDPNVWAKEYVLNVEKYRVPDTPDPFPEAEQHE